MSAVIHVIQEIRFDTSKDAIKITSQRLNGRPKRNFKKSFIRKYAHFQNVFSARSPFDKLTVHQTVRWKNVRSAKCLSAKCPGTAKLMP